MKPDHVGLHALRVNRVPADGTRDSMLEVGHWLFQARLVGPVGLGLVASPFFCASLAVRTLFFMSGSSHNSFIRQCKITRDADYARKIDGRHGPVQTIEASISSGRHNNRPSMPPAITSV